MDIAAELQCNEHVTQLSCNGFINFEFKMSQRCNGFSLVENLNKLGHTKQSKIYLNIMTSKIRSNK